MTTTDHRTPQRFPFEIDPTYGKVGWVFGVRPSTAWAEVSGRYLEARLGPWRVRTTLANVAEAVETGPYATAKTVGPAHLSFADRGLTFATNGERGVCLTFHRPVAGIEPLGLLRHRGLTVTVADPAAFIAAVTDVPSPGSVEDDDERDARDRLHAMTASELRQLAADRGIDHRAARKKAELVELLEADLGERLVDVIDPS